MSRVATSGASSKKATVKEKTRTPASGLADIAHSDPKRFRVLYPAYFNAKRSTAYVLNPLTTQHSLLLPTPPHPSPAPPLPPLLQ